MTGSPGVLLVCTGSDCRKRSAELGHLLGQLGQDVAVETVGCQKLCKGPVVGCDIGDRLEWFSRLRSKKLRRSVSRLLETGRIDGRLEKRRSRKRSGKLRT